MQVHQRREDIGEQPSGGLKHPFVSPSLQRARIIIIITFRRARLAAQVAVDVAQGKKPAAAGTLDNGAKQVPSVFEKIISVDKSNLATTVIADGFHSAASLR